MAQPQLDPAIYQYFQQVDTDRSGRLSEEELLRALCQANAGDCSPETVEILMALFDKDGSRQIDAYSFQELWGYLGQWRQVYQSYDVDQTNALDLPEVMTALHQMGYSGLPTEFFQLAMKKFDLNKRGYLAFDDFVRLGAFLQSTGKSWYKFDQQRQGVAQLSFENLLEIALFSTGPVPPSQQQAPMGAYGGSGGMQMQPVINITIENNNTNTNSGGGAEESRKEGYDTTDEVRDHIYAVSRGDGNLCYPCIVVTQKGAKWIPGKTNLKDAWYPYGGREYKAKSGDKAYLMLIEGETEPAREPTNPQVVAFKPPAGFGNFMKAVTGEDPTEEEEEEIGPVHVETITVGKEKPICKPTFLPEHLSEHQRSFFSVIANTEHGPVPGKAKFGDEQCYYTWDGDEKNTDDFEFIQTSSMLIYDMDDERIEMTTIEF